MAYGPLSPIPELRAHTPNLEQAKHLPISHETRSYHNDICSLLHVLQPWLRNQPQEFRDFCEKLSSQESTYSNPEQDFASIELAELATLAKIFGERQQLQIFQHVLEERLQKNKASLPPNPRRPRSPGVTQIPKKILQQSLEANERKIASKTAKWISNNFPLPVSASREELINLKRSMAPPDDRPTVFDLRDHLLNAEIDHRLSALPH